MVDFYENVPNYDDVIRKKEIVHYSNSRLGPNQPCRICIVGPTGSGKTNVLLDLLFRWMKWNKVIYICKNVKEDKALFLQHKMDKYQIKIDKKNKKKNIESYNIFDMYDTLEDLPDMSDINPGDTRDFHTLVIINDLVLSCQHKLAKFFYLSRHKRISMIYLTQFYFSMDKTMRDSITDLMIFKFHDFRNVGKLHQIVGNRVTLEVFKQLYNEIMEEPYNFMYIDTRTPFIELHIRKNFNTLYTPYF